MFAVSSPGGVGPREMSKVAQLAVALDAELELFHCIFDAGINQPGRFGTRGVQRDIHEFVDRRRQQLERVAEGLRARGVRVRTSVRWDYPSYEGIVRQVLRHEPALLVAQSARKGRAARLVLTQTDSRLIETCPCPVLFVKNDRPYRDVVIVAAVDPARAHGKPDTLDDEILSQASAICRALHGKLKVFHAYPPWEYAEYMSPELRELPGAVREEARTAYGRQMEARVLALARRHDVAEESVRVLEGDAAERLLEAARRASAGIVVLGAVLRSRVGRALIGHTSERVLDGLDCDLLVVKPPGFRSPVRPQSTHHVERRPSIGWTSRA